MSNFANRSKMLARTAEEARRYAIVKKVLTSLMLSITIVVSLTYIVSVLYSKYGSFTVSIAKSDAIGHSLSLSEDSSFNEQITRLNAKMAADITNISVNDLPEDVDAINGEHNGKNNLAYTFYLKNVGKDTVTYEYYMFITNVTNNVDNAIRIRIYKDGEPITYAKTRSNGKGAEDGTTEFLTKRSVARVQVPNFKPGDITKFTVVIWVEGDDVDCVDELIGGALKTDMNISVIEASDVEGE